MKVVETSAELDGFLESFRVKTGPIGFIPTMGALHAGHLSLLERAKSECIVSVVSIFVNPTQFNDLKDLENYPRTLESDLKMLEKAGADVVFVPSVSEMYPNGLATDILDINFGMLEKVMEGKSRPGHFMGMATVVNKLFQMVKPDKAYFGKKDYQQLAIVREMALRQAQDDSRPPVAVIGCETIREKDGLAMSSRNQRLNVTQRTRAALISSVLYWAKMNAETLSVEELQKGARAQLMEEVNFQLEYFEIVDRDTLQPLSTNDIPINAVACVALKIGDIRLIDNIEI